LLFEDTVYVYFQIELCNSFHTIGIDNTIQIIFVTAAEEYYENFRKQYYPALSNDININCLQKPITNEELMKIVDMTIATRNVK
jgi:two-component SAPR family response regulator